MTDLREGVSWTNIIEGFVGSDHCDGKVERGQVEDILVILTIDVWLPVTSRQKAV